jgi:hypothetical protein
VDGIKQVLLVAGSVAALTIVALAAYFLFAYPSFISLIGFFVIVPVFLILGLGFFKIARNQAQQRKQR